MKKKIFFGSIFTGLMLLITPCVVSIEHKNQKTVISNIHKIDNLAVSKKMELRPHLLFYIASGDFYVDGNIVQGDAIIVFMLSLIYFIFPQPHIEFNTRFEAYIITDFYEYYKILYTNHTICILAIYR